MENYVLLSDERVKFIKTPDGKPTFVNHPQVSKSYIYGGCSMEPTTPVVSHLAIELNNGIREEIEFDGQDDLIQKTNQYLNTL